MNGRAISFGPFLLLAEERLLLEGDRPLRLGGRAFDILVFLIERAGEVVGKEELIARVWPQTFVEEANLKIQVSALRRALGDGQGGNRYIVTVVGRGYNFVAPIRIEAPSLTRQPATLSIAKHNLPLAVTRIIGREQAVETLISRLSRQRLVTVIGPGEVSAKRRSPSPSPSEWLPNTNMASGWSIWHLSEMLTLCRARSGPRSAFKSIAKIRFGAWSPPSETHGCSCCSIIASISSTRWRA
jgi:DNA-binding winged helix-turn-helix (wHTH) protein